MSGIKRRAELPLRARLLGSQVSKADLLEAAWHLASLAHEGGCDDEEGTFARLCEEIETLRQNQGRGPAHVARAVARAEAKSKAYMARQAAARSTRP